MSEAAELHAEFKRYVKKMGFQGTLLLRRIVPLCSRLHLQASKNTRFISGRIRLVTTTVLKQKS
jgi:hypothetical protein